MSTTVLIVDDDPVQRRLLSAAVERMGHTAVTADGGEAGIAHLTGREGDAVALVILDLVMPDLDGMACWPSCARLDRQCR